MPLIYSGDLRQKAVNAYNDGQGSFATLGKLFGVNPGSIRNWVIRKKEKGTLEPDKHPGQKSSIDSTCRDYIMQRVLNDPSVRLLTICDEIQEKFDVIASESYMCKILKKMGFKRKKFQLIASEQLTEKVKKSGLTFN